ncbi:MAG TPA: hypothetical protein VGJ03_14830 [Acidimicrobiales bacterium]|jgi:hypothetical protein
MATEAEHDIDDDMPDPELVWRWVGKATRPVVGWVLLGLGGVFILMGWIGVSGETIVAKQIPYVVSGGIAGVVLAIIGAYFLGTEELRKDSGRLDRLERMVDELHATLLQQTTAGAVARPNASVNGSSSSASPRSSSPSTAQSSSAPSSSAEPASSFVAINGGSTYHRPGCPMVEGKSGSSVMAPSTVRKRGLEACPLCEPAAVTP